VNIIPAKDFAEAMKIAEELYDRHCDLLRCPTPKERRVTKCYDVPVRQVDTKELACRVPSAALVAVALIADAAKLTTVAKEDEAKWQPVVSAADAEPMGDDK